MAGGLAALLDDVAAFARLAAASVDDVGAAAGRAGAKAAGVVVDDTAVTPRYVHGLAAEREIPVVRRIAFGSLRNKLLIILPLALLLSQVAPWLLTPVLMVGGSYLAYEGAEKVWEAVSGHAAHTAVPAAVEGPDAEDAVVAGAVRTDFILSAEIMVIALYEVAAETLLSRAVILTVVAVGITVLVYGVVALIVKADDVGLRLAGSRRRGLARLGRGVVRSMPGVLKVLSTVGVVAMLWVGGHILLTGADTLGWHAPYEVVHHLEDALATVPAVGGVLAWVVATAAAALVGLVVGAVVVALRHLLPRRGPRGTQDAAPVH